MGIAFASILDVASNVGYPLLALLVMAESAGVPLPGETALITAGILTTNGKLDLPLVIVVAAAAAIVGDNIGYLIGRKGGRYVLERPGAFESQRHSVLAYGEPFFERHGPKAVFFGRWILGLRTWASWLAGATRMRWRSFAFWNALGGISWAATIAIIGAVVGSKAKDVVSAFGIWALAAIVLAVVSLLVTHRVVRARRARHRLAPGGDAPAPPPAPAPGDSPRSASDAGA